MKKKILYIAGIIASVFFVTASDASLLSSYLERDVAFDKNVHDQIEEEYQNIEYDLSHPYVKNNPYGRNELVALVKFKTDTPTQIELTIKGKEGADDIRYLFSDFSVNHEIPVLGLYPNSNNHIILKAIDKKGKIKESQIDIYTNKIEKRAFITVDSKKDTKTYYHYLQDGIVLDEQGWIRFSFKSDKETTYWLNHELISEDRNAGLTRYSILGQKMQHYPYPAGFVSFSHGMAQKPNGNFLVIGSFKDKEAWFNDSKQQTQREFIIELDYKTGNLVNKIDLANILNPNRSFIVKAARKLFGLNDWCHINSVDYDSMDNGILISCRHSGVAKIDEKTHQLLWLFGPNIGLDQSGRDGKQGALTNKVLIATDQQGRVLSEDIQAGKRISPFFKWPMKTHHAKVAGKNLYSVFDNAGVLYDKSIDTTASSNALVYYVDPKKKHVKQIWQENLKVHSDVASSVLYRPWDDSVVVYASVVYDKNQKGIAYGQIIRYNLKTHQPMFEAKVYRGGETYFYRVDEFLFYPVK